MTCRTSKLTWLLSGCLGGNSLTTILATVSPSMEHATVTKAALKFAHSCKRIEHVVSQNTARTLRRCQRRLKRTGEGEEVVVVREVVETSAGSLACYYAGPPEGRPVVLLHGCRSSTAGAVPPLPSCPQSCSTCSPA